MRSKRLALAVVVVSGVTLTAYAKKAPKGNAQQKKAIPGECSGCTMHGLPGNVYHLAAGTDGVAWLLSDSGVYRFGKCGWERYGTSAHPSGPGWTGMWVDEHNELWIYALDRVGQMHCTTPKGMHTHCSADPIPDSILRLDGSQWTKESTLPASAPRKREAIDVPGLKDVSPQSQAFEMGGTEKDLWVLAEEHRDVKIGDGHGTWTLPEVWRRRGGKWSVMRPLRWGDEITDIAFDRNVMYASLARGSAWGGLLVRSKGTWTDPGIGATDMEAVTALALIDGQPWLLHGCQVTRHPNGTATPDRTIEYAKQCAHGGHSDFSALADDDLWIVNSTIVYHYDAGALSTWDLKTPLESILAFSATDVWVAGSDGAWHWDGKQWSKQDQGISPKCSSAQLTLSAINGAAPDDIWAIGGSCSRDPQIAHWDGKTWTSFSDRFFPTRDIGTLLVRSSTDVYVTGNGLFHWDGTAWTQLPYPTGAPITAIAATDTTLWVGDRNGTIYERALPKPKPAKKAPKGKRK